MENASKALIIAGAILLAILIIGLGVFIYRQAAGVIDTGAMDQLAVNQFNAQFEPYLNNIVSSGDFEGQNNATLYYEKYILEDANLQIIFRNRCQKRRKRQKTSENVGDAYKSQQKRQSN